MADTIPAYKADTRLAKLLKAAAKAGVPLRVEADDDSYEVRVQRTGTPLRSIEDYDPDTAREALRDSFGILSNLDADAFIAEMKASRE